MDDVSIRYSLDPSGYVSGGKTVASVTKALGLDVDSLHAKTKALGGGIGDMLGGAVRSLALPLAGIGAGIAAAGTYAVHTALDFDTMRRSMEAVTGSAKRTADILGFVDKLAMPSIFTSAELGAAAKTLEAFGLTTERFLPIAEKLGTVFGGTAGDLNQFVDALGFIQGGRTGEGIEALARAGIGRDALKAKGLQFDKGGQFLGEVNQLFDAVELIVGEKFGTLSEKMASGPAAKIASAMDAIQRAARKAGDGILTILAPAIERVGFFIQYLVDSGTVERLVAGLSGLSSGQNLGNGLVKILAFMTSALINAPQLIQGISTMFQYLYKHISQVAGILVGIFSVGPIAKGIIGMIELFGVLKTAIANMGIAAAISQTALAGVRAAAVGLGIAAAAWAVSVAVTKLFDSIGGGIGANLQKLPGVQDFQNTYQGILTGFDKGAPGASGPGAVLQSAQTGIQSLMTKHMERTAKATETTARNTRPEQLQRILLGGGELGRIGVSPVELFGSGGGGSGVEKAIRNLVKEIGGSMAVHNRDRARAGLRA